MNQKFVFVLFVIAFGLAWFFNSETSNGQAFIDDEFSLSGLFSGFNRDWNCPRNRAPFDNKDFLLSQCDTTDRLCGRYDYETEW